MDLSNFFGIKKSNDGRINITLFGLKIKFATLDSFKKRKELMNYYKKYNNPTEIPPAEGNLRLIQKANLKFLKVFDELCAEYDIKYWLDFGSLLGAIRHKGYIPWDDDIDVGMMRDDYERFIKLFEDKVINRNDISLKYNNNLRNKCFIKIQSENSENLFVDIFPYDYHHSKLSDNDKKIFSEKIKSIMDNKLNKSKTVEEIRDRFKRETTEKLLENKAIDKSVEPAIFMAVDYPHRWTNKVYDYENIFPLKKIEFENEMFYAPNMPETVLKSIFGDYMKMPKDCYPRHSSYANMSHKEKTYLEQVIESI